MLRTSGTVLRSVGSVGHLQVDRVAKLPLWASSTSLLYGVPVAVWSIITHPAVVNDDRRDLECPTQTLLHGTDWAHFDAMFTPRTLLSSSSPSTTTEKRPSSIFCATPANPNVALAFAKPASRASLMNSTSELRHLMDLLTVDEGADELMLAWVVEVDCDLRGTQFEPDGPDSVLGGDCVWTAPGIDAAAPVCFPFDGAIAYSVPWSRVVQIRGTALGFRSILKG
jgi:hypothetical protein